MVSGLLVLSATVSVGSAVLPGRAESLFLASLAHSCSLDNRASNRAWNLSQSSCRATCWPSIPVPPTTRIVSTLVVAPSASFYGRFAERSARIATIASVTKPDTSPAKTTSASRPARGLP
jgi:hypothetical protein